MKMVHSMLLAVPVALFAAACGPSLDTAEPAESPAEYEVEMTPASLPSRSSGNEDIEREYETPSGEVDIETEYENDD